MKQEDYKEHINLSFLTDEIGKNIHIMAQGTTSVNRPYNMRVRTQTQYYSKDPVYCKRLLRPHIVDFIQGGEIDPMFLHPLLDGESYCCDTTPNVIITITDWCNLCNEVKHEWDNMMRFDDLYDNEDDDEIYDWEYDGLIIDISHNIKD